MSDSPTTTEKKRRVVDLLEALCVPGLRHTHHLGFLAQRRRHRGRRGRLDDRRRGQGSRGSRTPRPSSSPSPGPWRRRPREKKKGHTRRRRRRTRGGPQLGASDAGQHHLLLGQVLRRNVRVPVRRLAPQPSAHLCGAEPERETGARSIWRGLTHPAAPPVRAGT